jgi:hypothetical protein
VLFVKLASRINFHDCSDRARPGTNHEPCQAYQAWEIRADYKTAMPLFERAVSLDPDLAMAYFSMSYAGQFEPVRAGQHARKA